MFLAFGAAELPDGELEQLTPATVTDRERLRRELEAIRDQGYATIVDELEPGLSAVAAPVRDRGGTVIAALTASGASLRLAPQRLRLLGRVALEQAHALSTRLGHDAPLDEYLAARGQVNDDGPGAGDDHAILEVTLDRAGQHRRSMSRPIWASASTLSRWLTRAVSCSMIGPASSSSLT